jgi:drug/metabolite transporter (DMT)-like permease
LRIFILPNITLSVARMHLTSTPASSRARLLLAAVAGVLAVLIYGGQFVASRFSLQQTLSPWDLAALRLGVAGVLSLPLAIRRGLPGAAGIGWRRAIVLAITVGAPYTFILYSGLAVAPAIHGAVIIPGATPLFAAALAWVWLGEETAPKAILGLILILAGIALVSWPTIIDLTGDPTWSGDALFLVAGLLWAIYTVLVRRWRVGPLQATAMVWVLALPYIPIYLALDGGARLLAAPRGEVIFQAIYQGVGVSLVALLLYSRAIRTLGAESASVFMPLIPIFGALFAVPVLGEMPDHLQLAGMIMVTVGIALAAGRSLSSRVFSGADS